MRKNIFAFGEVLWDMLPSCSVLGGAPFNFVYRVNSIGDVGLMVSRLGVDEPGKKAFAQIVSLGLETKFLQWDDKLPTGTVKVSFDEENHPHYLIVPEVAYDNIEVTAGLLEAVSTADCVCFGTLSQRSEKSRKSVRELLEASSDSLKFLDINLRTDCYDRKIVAFSLEKANALKLNAEEVRRLGTMLGISHRTIPEFCEEISGRFFLQYCVVTLGAKGAFACSEDGENVYVPGYRVPVTDCLGCGDAFSAGFVHKILRRRSVRQACEYGNILGALVATQTAATSPITPDQMKSFGERNYERIIDPDLAEHREH